MEDRIEEMFVELCESVGAEAWWQTEEYWSEWEAVMVEAGLDAEAVADFFSEMAWEL